ncbi:MAG: hypothetical protein PWP51_2513 [Clostridiales bacterium]|nr:hypothetical protein [Clostridiales bacterium]
MRLKSIERIAVGEVLGKSVYDDKCQLLLARNVALTQNYIDRLKQASIQCVYIEDEISEGIEPENVVSQELKLKSVNVIQNVFKQATGKKSVGFDAMQVDQIKDIIDEMMEIVFSHRDTLYVMAELMGTDMYTYNHSAEVAVLSMLVAKSLGLNHQFIQKIGVGAMLHDIGKMKIPNEVLNKITPLSDEEMKLVKEHARFGYDILKESVSISPISRQIILLHHEKLDGNGYPMRLTADEIPVHVRIVTMCDIFNALVSNRAYREKLNVDEALEILRAEAIYQLDREIYYHLLKVVNIYPPGTIVELSNGMIGIVIKENREAQTRPLVQLIVNNKKGDVVNLMDNLTLFITKTIEL